MANIEEQKQWVFLTLAVILGISIGMMFAQKTAPQSSGLAISQPASSEINIASQAECPEGTFVDTDGSCADAQGCPRGTVPFSDGTCIEL